MQSFTCLLVIGMILSLCTGESSAQCVNHGHIKKDPGSLSRCDQLYTVLEEALISGSENLYALRRTFYPQTGLPAPLLCVIYNITSDDELIANGSTNVQITIKRSTSSLFSVINPYVLLEFVSGYILLFVERNLEAEEIAISLDIIDMITPVRSTEQEIIETLEILTTRLEAYAKEQGKLTDWDGTGRGYTWEYEYLSQWFWLFLIGDIFLSLFSIALAPQIYLTIKKVAAKRFQQQTSKATQDQKTTEPSSGAHQSEITAVEGSDNNKSIPGKTFKGDKILYIFAVVLAVICLLEFVCSIYVTVRAAAICPTQSCLEEVILTRVIIICFVVIIGIVGGLIFVFVIDTQPQQPQQQQQPEQQQQQNTDKVQQFCKEKIVNFFISAREFYTVAGFFAVFVLLAVNVIPTIILGFVFPFEVITGIVYLPMIGIVILLYTEVSSYIISEWENNINKKDVKKRILTKDRKVILYWSFTIVIILLFVSAATVIFVFSFTVHNAEVHPSFVSTLIPPIILFLLTTLAKKYVIDKYDPPQTVNINKCAEALPVKNTDTTT